MGFEYSHTVRFHETDAAGVVYFANGLVLCHQAYEASLDAAGVDLREFFSPRELAFPIVHASIDFRRPLRCGDRVVIKVSAQQEAAFSFAVSYAIHHNQVCAATALTRHVCINAERQRSPLPPPMQDWLQSRDEGGTIQSLQ